MYGPLLTGSDLCYRPLQLKPSGGYADAAAAVKGVTTRLSLLRQRLCIRSDKRRFFQLSYDLTTLRWAWNKYVVLYYVDAISADESALTLTLHMALDPGVWVLGGDGVGWQQGME